jgi:hypothetical protein
MPNFANGKIYKLWSPEGDDIYIGSTTRSLCRRKAGHKFEYNCGKNVSSKILFEKYYDVRIELVEEFPCENKMELNKREGYYIRTLECVNKQIPDRTQKEWIEDNKEKIKEQKKQYNEANKEKFKEINKKYREENKEYFKDKRKEWCEKNKDYYKQYSKEYNLNKKEEIKEYQKKWRENNKEKNKEYKQKYREANREKINEKERERYVIKKNLVSVQSPVLSPEQSVE